MVVVGAGHNALVAATLLARAGQGVIVLERNERIGGATVSERPFAGHDAWLSRYSYLVSLFPRWLLDELGVAVRLQRRRMSSYTPTGDAGVLIGDEESRTRASMIRALGSDRALSELQALGALIGPMAGPVFASLTEPLRSRAAFAALVGDREAFCAVFERPLGELLTRALNDDLVRGIVATDALIGTFAGLHEAQLRQNRCFLLHVIGGGTGHWDVPVGGMGALSAGLQAAAERAGAKIVSGAPVVSLAADGRCAEAILADGTVIEARHVLAGVAPAVLAGLLGDPAPEPAPEGSQLKLNLLLSRLPRLRDPEVSASDAFAGTFHVNEGFEQLERAYAQASAGQLPALVPCEAYCHSLSDPSILGPQLRRSGAQTLTVFALHMPARLFAGPDAEAVKRDAVQATLQSLNSVLAEPVEGCLALDADGRPCVEARTPVELEAELGMPGGHIFHRDLSWPFAEREQDVGAWGVETERANVWLCGAGARRGGGVSGIPGHNAAQAVLGRLSR